MSTAKRVDTTVPQQLLTVREVSDLIRKDTWSVYDLIHSRELEAIDVGTKGRKVWRVQPVALNRYLEVRKSTAD